MNGPINIAFPLAFDGTGRTALADRDAHIRQMIEQLLFTEPGERVMRPTFGCALLQLVFAPNSPSRRRGAGDRPGVASAVAG